MATTSSTSSSVPESAYKRYTSSEVIELLEIDEPLLDDSGDELDLNLGSGDEL